MTALSHDDVLSRLLGFIRRELVRDPALQLNTAEPLITSGLIDSFALAEIAVFVESEFGVYIPDIDLTVEKMDTPAQMVARILQG